MGWCISIGVEGQFYLSFNIGGNIDFIRREDLTELTIYEYAGNVVPSFELEFVSSDESILERLNEGNSIEVIHGLSKDEVSTATLYTSSLSTSRIGAGRREYVISGFAVNTDYIINHNILITPKQSAIETVLEIAANNFEKVVSNIAKSLDKQNWIQHNITDRKFLTDVIMRSNLGTSFPVTAIMADSTFIIHDLEKLINTAKVDWRFTKNPTGKTDIVYDTDNSIESKAGFINTWIGYGKELKVINNITGVVDSVFEDPKIIMATAKKLDKSESITKRYGGSRHISDNVADTYWSSFNHNLQSLANLSKIDNTVSFTHQYKAVKPLDIISFREESNKSEIEASEYSGGKYIASGVIRTYQGNVTSTVVVLNREAFNRVKTNVN